MVFVHVIKFPLLKINMNMDESKLPENYIEHLRDRLHNHLGTFRLAIGLRAEKLVEDLRNEGSAHALEAEELDLIVRTLWIELRLLFLDLGAPQLEGKSLLMALRKYINDIGEILDVKSILKIDEKIDQFPHIAEGFFLIAREAISNAIRHGKPGLVLVKATWSGNCFTLEIIDDGKGFDVNTYQPGYGTQYMTSIAESLGGELSLKSVSGEGTTVAIYISSN